jgi:hypothetical protein
VYLSEFTDVVKISLKVTDLTPLPLYLVIVAEKGHLFIWSISVTNRGYSLYASEKTVSILRFGSSLKITFEDLNSIDRHFLLFSFLGLLFFGFL